jgi:GntR family transcriptional regulator, transcriptional repressor for pyruvate dehydrogenase complex
VKPVSNGSPNLGPRLTVSQTAVSRIQEMIQKGELPLGEVLPPQRVLSERLNVSRGSLREALSVLETIGILRTEPRRGTFVVNGSNEITDVHRWRFGERYSPPEVYQFRFVVEGYAARLAALRASARDLLALNRNLDKFKDAVRNEDLASSSRLDFEFHSRILRVSGNRMFAAVHATYGAVMLESQKLPLNHRERLWEPVTEHENVLQAIEKHDPDRAVYFMHVHILRAANRIGIELTDKIA